MARAVGSGIFDETPCLLPTAYCLLSFRIQPIRPDADIHHQGHLQLHHSLHVAPDQLAHGWLLLFSAAEPGSARSLIEGLVASLVFAWIAALLFGWAYNRLSRG